MTPVALSNVGVPNSPVNAPDEYPTHGLGIYDDYESWDSYTGYVWSTWTTKEARPVHIDPALQAMIDQSSQMRSGSVGPTYHVDPQASSCVSDESKESPEMTSATQTPFPSSVEDVTMEFTADKRSRESPDSTLKPEGKSLKTSEVATATAASATSICAVDVEVPDTSNSQTPTIRWKPKTVPEASAKNHPTRICHFLWRDPVFGLFWRRENPVQPIRAKLSYWSEVVRGYTGTPWKCQSQFLVWVGSWPKLPKHNLGIGHTSWTLLTHEKATFRVSSDQVEHSRCPLPGWKHMYILVLLSLTYPHWSFQIPV